MVSTTDQEQELVVPDEVTPEFTRGLKAPTQKFLCKLSDNWAGFRFCGFKIRDMVSNMVLVDVPADEVEGEDQLSDDDDPTKRLIKYHLGPEFLQLKTVGLTMNFSIGSKPINTLQMQERHYFRGKVIRDYEFKFGFVIPKSTNSWEFVYDMPDMTAEEKAEIINAPWEVKSDTFFFADGKLMLHNRAEYNYAPF